MKMVRFRLMGGVLQGVDRKLETNVTGPAKIDHVSAKKSPIFSVFAVS